MNRIISIFILISAFSIAAFAQTQTALCPTLHVNGGGVVRPGEPMIFTVNVAGLTDASTLKYEWEISNGTISSGQGTAAITVDTTGLSDTNVTAEVKIKGLYNNCPNTASEIGSVAGKIGCGRPFDEFGKLGVYELRVRIQNFYVELSNNETAQGYLINYGTDKEIADRERQIQKSINLLQFDSNRLTMVRGGENPNGAGVYTKVWIVLPGAEFPSPDYNE